MDLSTVYLIAADVILLLHVILVTFVVIGLLLVFVGKHRDWHWVRNPWFRLTHLAVIAVVVVQSWFGFICPFTSIEMGLRAQAGQTVYSGSFLSHWLDKLLYYQLPAWVFIVAYMMFGVLVCLAWLWVRPRSLLKKVKT